jgi:hypothetical protein
VISRRTVAVLLLVLSSGCKHTFPKVYDLEQLRADSAKWPGEALVHYLSRPNATAGACAASNFATQDSTLLEPFVDALEEGTTKPALWGECAQRLLQSLAPEQRAELVQRLAKLVPRFIEKPELLKLRAAYDVLATRPREPSEALSKLREKLGTLQVEAKGVRAMVDALSELLDLEDGLYAGAALTEASILQLDDEALLRRIDARVPDEALRTASRRRIIRKHLALATMREVKERAAEVEAALLAQGRWIQPIAKLPAPVPQPPLVAPVDVRVAQDIAAQLARPFLAGGDPNTPPAIDLKPLVKFHVGWSEPLMLCADAADLAVNPCIDATELSLGSGFGTLDGTGVLHLNAKWAIADLVDLVQAGLGVVVPIKLGDKLAQVVQVPLSAQTPSAYCFEGGPTDRGPHVSASVVPVAHGLLVEAIEERGGRVQFVLPRGAAGFEFGSCGGRGRQGTPGTPGIAGANGNAGTSASCPSMPGGRGGNGANGTPGGRGGDGGPGGEGGVLRVELHCGKACEDEMLVRAVFKSKGGLGGEGGAGGVGGRGGNGGAGGSGTSCTVNGRTNFLSGGSQGSPGSAGANGMPGNRGAPGRDGPVEVTRR